MGPRDADEPGPWGIGVEAGSVWRGVAARIAPTGGHARGWPVKPGSPPPDSAGRRRPALPWSRARHPPAIPAGGRSCVPPKGWTPAVLLAPLLDRWPSATSYAEILAALDEGGADVVVPDVARAFLLAGIATQAGRSTLLVAVTATSADAEALAAD